MLLACASGGLGVLGLVLEQRAQGLRLRPRVGATLEAESGTNDPFAVFLTLMLVELISSGQSSVWHVVLEFGREAVLAPNVSLTASVPIIDVTGPEPVEHRGYVPPRAVVVPGTRPKEFPAGTYHLACALIIGRRTASTDLRTSLNDALREYGL